MSGIPRNKVNRRAQQVGHSDGPSSSPAPPPPFTLVSLKEASKTRKPYGMGKFPFPLIDVYGPEGPMVQMGQPGSSTPLGVEEGGMFSPARSNVLEDAEAPGAHGHKKQKQWTRWMTEILPKLVEPYLALLHKTDSLRTPMTGESDMVCGCGGKKRKIEDPLRRRFANAFHWFEKLDHLKERRMQEAIAASRSLIFTELQKLTTEPNAENEGNDQLRPSDYLRAKCPLCFGSSTAHRTDQEVDIIVCLDANFTQKRRRNPYGSGQGPPDTHAETVFLSKEKVEHWRDQVESDLSVFPIQF
ncbi:hypothetical protein H0H93_001148 [Arthromyces matolae]|nr:hypothetical protein H0H93_001148 [Arthromyces matolae]